LLRRSCAAYPDFSALNRRLNELYGAWVSADVVRIGESQALVLMAGSIHDQFALHGEAVTAQCAELLQNMVFEPASENGMFRAADVEQEKRILIELIESEVNEKRLYARQRCEQLMCEGERYAVSRYGDSARVAALTPEKITAAWKRALLTAQVQLIVQGANDEKAQAKTVMNAFRDKWEQVGNRSVVSCATVLDYTLKNPVKELTERMAVNQCKLVMGFRTNIAEPESRVAAMRLMNALLGGTPHSLFFRNIREKLSLCYYCSSSYDRHKGVMLVDSGVEEQKAEQTKTEVLRQLEAVRQGDFTDEDLESARRSVINQFRSVGDSQANLAAWYIGQSVLEKLITPEQAAADVIAVTRQQVMDAAKTVVPDSVYLLAAGEENEDD
jgi:predicted Zn-dependent peptidase